MPTVTEQQPTNTKPKQSAYLVCEGAQCTCAGSKVKAMLKVSSHKKAYINNDKLVVTVKDITFEQGPKPFGTCSLSTSQDKSCTPQFEQWLKPYKDIEVEGNQVITDQSELLCLTWKGIITVNTHGQEQTVNETQANYIDRTIAMQVNPLADLVPLNVDTAKMVEVNSITRELVEDPKYKSVTNQQIDVIKSKDIEDPVDMYLRPGQEATFTAAYKAGGTAALVCWKITGAKGPMHFLQHGSVYKTSFPEVGKYTIEGYGTGGDHNVDIDKKFVENKKTHLKELKNRLDDKACMLEILVQENKLTDIRHLTSDNVVDKLDKGKFSEAHVRVGLPVTFEPVYLMPPVQTEIDELILLIKDASGNELKRSTGQPNIMFEVQNSAANYSVEAYFDGSEEKPFTYKFRTALNAISVIAVTGMETENAKIRPGTTLTFSVSQSKFMNDYKVLQEVLDAEKATIKWYENSDKPVATGITTYSNIYQREGKYVVTCAVKEKSAGWFTTKKNEEDDWRFEVINNYPTGIERKTAGKAKVGKPIKFELKGIFEINYSDTTSIHWELSGPETISRTRTKRVFIYTATKRHLYADRKNE